MNIFQSILKMTKDGGIKYTMSRITQRVVDELYLNVCRLLFFPCKSDNILVIESHNDFDCNGGAFYDYLINNGINDRWTIVWLIRNPLTTVLPQGVIAFNYYKKSLRKELYLNKAKILMYDDKHIKKRRKKQIVVYCQHGLSIKNVKGRIIVPSYVDYILSSSSNYDPMLCNNISAPYPNNKMLHFGYPYNDVLFAEIDDECEKITTGIFSKKILWMPTFRKKNEHRNDSNIELPFGIPLILSAEQLESLNNKLKILNYLLIIKLHPMQTSESYALLHDYSNIIVLNGDLVKKLSVDNYRLMKSCDAMISDYSSAAYSYLLLDRPLGFVLSDLEHYNLGLSVDNYHEFMPGKIILTIEDMFCFIDNLSNDKDDFTYQRKKLIDFLYNYKDGNASERLATFLKIK